MAERFFTTPRDFSSSRAVQVFIEAPDNISAIQGISRWAEEQGFVRVPESQLRVVLKNGVKYFSSICYRWEQEDREGAEDWKRRAAERIEKMPKTRSSVDILREEKQ